MGIVTLHDPRATSAPRASLWAERIKRARRLNQYAGLSAIRQDRQPLIEGLARDGHCLNSSEFPMENALDAAMFPDLLVA
jgi:hypothetical protein